MKEYRIEAYFRDVYGKRSYKRKIYMSRKEAEKDLPEAVEYYHCKIYIPYLDRVVIESREVTEWDTDQEEEKQYEME